MAQYEVWRKKYPYHVIIGLEWKYYTAHSLSADVMAQLTGRECQISINGKKSISTTNLEKWTNLLKEQKYAYLVFSGDELIELVDGENPFICLPDIIYQTQIFQTISALRDGINPETGEFFEDQSFVFSNMTKEILSLAEKYLLLTDTSILVQKKSIEKSSIEASEVTKEELKDEIGAFAQYKRKLYERGLTHAYEPWTEDEEHIVIEDYDRGLSIAEIADKQNRTPGAIRSRLTKLGRIINVGIAEKSSTFIDTTIKEPIEIKLRCEDCHIYRKGDCGGAGPASECEQYVPAVNISKEERALWPTMGDASAIRTRDFERFK